MTPAQALPQNFSERLVLASRSPRRRELLALLLPHAQIDVVPPGDPTEAGFEHVRDEPALRARLTAIAEEKNAQVRQQIGPGCWTLSADTVIVADGPGGQPVVLGQPPDSEPEHSHTVRTWFTEMLLGRTHRAISAVCVSSPVGDIRTKVATSIVTMRDAGVTEVDAYIATGEPRSKAGGYAVQGLGSLFVERIDGSFTNIVGLPLEAVRELFNELAASDAAGTSEGRASS